MEPVQTERLLDLFCFIKLWVLKLRSKYLVIGPTVLSIKNADFSDSTISKELAASPDPTE